MHYDKVTVQGGDNCLHTETLYGKVTVYGEDHCFHAHNVLGKVSMYTMYWVRSLCKVEITASRHNMLGKVTV